MPWPIKSAGIGVEQGDPNHGRARDAEAKESGYPQQWDKFLAKQIGEHTSVCIRQAGKVSYTKRCLSGAETAETRTRGPFQSEEWVGANTQRWAWAWALLRNWIIASDKGQPLDLGNVKSNPRIPGLPSAIWEPLPNSRVPRCLQRKSFPLFLKSQFATISPLGLLKELAKGRYILSWFMQTQKQVKKLSFFACALGMTLSPNRTLSDCPMPGFK